MDFNIVYFAFVGGVFGGVEQKVISQFDALFAKNNRTFLYLVSSTAAQELLAKEISKRANVKLLVNAEAKLSNPYFRRKEKFQLLTEVLKNYNADNTVIYFRYPDSDLIFLRFLKAHDQFTFVTEHQEIENTFRNFKRDGRYLNNLLEIISGRKVRKEITAFVGVTPEITDFEIRICGQNGKRSITIGNGIDVKKYPVRKVNKNDPGLIKLLFVGGGLRRHGLDRILKGIAQYYQQHKNKYRILLRIAGSSNDLEQIKKLVARLKLRESVEFLGNKTPQDLNEHFDWADLGVGSLGFHRIGLKFTSNLKAREYFSRGLPFFGSTIDLDLQSGSNYVLNFPSEDTPIDIKTVVDFALRMRTDQRHTESMRSFAIDNLDWSIKMNTLISFLASLRVLLPLNKSAWSASYADSKI